MKAVSFAPPSFKGWERGRGRVLPDTEDEAIDDGGGESRPPWMKPPGSCIELVVVAICEHLAMRKIREREDGHKEGKEPLRIQQ